MKRHAFLSFLCAVLLLFGCGKEDGPALGSQMWEAPALTYGVMAHDKLDTLPWDSGRCEGTSFEFMAETKQGYYMNVDYRQLLYADKADLANWVPLCNKPNCAHRPTGGWSYGETVCNSEQQWGSFAVRDGRIWYIWIPYGKGYDELGGALALMSMAPDGGDKKIECLMETGAPTKETDMAYAYSRETLYNMVEMAEDGSRVGHCYRVVNGQLEEYATRPVEEEDYSVSRVNNAYSLPVYGDSLVYNGLISPTQTSYLRYLEEGYEILELGELPVEFSYLSGDVLRFFRPGDGYYDMNIRTGEEVKLAEACLENSHAVIPLPNCIIESTLMTYYSLESRTPGQTHTMMLFDGAQWREVALPPELQITDTAFLRFKCVTSDSIIFRLQDFSLANHMEKSDMYRIDLTRKNLALECFAHLNQMVPCK